MRRWPAIAPVIVVGVVLVNLPVPTSAQQADDLAFVLTRALYPVQLMAWCWREVDKAPEIAAAADGWTERNGDMLENLETMGTAAGVTAEVRNAADVETLATIEATVAGQYDAAAYCRTMARLIDEGRFDLDRRADLEEPLKRIFDRE